MRLLSLTRHLKEQNWLAVLLDFLIVVVGVFIGLQVSNWNQEWMKAERESMLLHDIVEDLQADLEELDIVIEFGRLRYSAQTTLLKRATGWKIPDSYPNGLNNLESYPTPPYSEPELATEALYLSVRFASFDMETRTYSMLLASGEMKFNRYPELGEQLRKHYNEANEWTTGETAHHAPLYVKILEQLAQHGLGPLDNIDWAELDKIIASDPTLQGQLKQAIWLSNVQYIFLNMFKGNIEALIKAIESDQD